MTFLVPEKISIRNITDVYGNFLTYIENNTTIEIDLDTCGECDLSLVQLIESARKSADSGGKSISLTKPANDSVRSILKRAGLMDAFSAGDAKFWLHEEVL